MKILKKLGLLYLGAIMLTLVGYGLDKDPMYEDKSLIFLEFFIMSVIIFIALVIFFGLILLLKRLYQRK
jgi:hypothetical protein